MMRGLSARAGIDDVVDFALGSYAGSDLWVLELLLQGRNRVLRH